MKKYNAGGGATTLRWLATAPAWACWSEKKKFCRASLSKFNLRERKGEEEWRKKPDPCFYGPFFKPVFFPFWWTGPVLVYFYLFFFPTFLSLQILCHVFDLMAVMHSCFFYIHVLLFLLYYHALVLFNRLIYDLMDLFLTV